MRNFLTATVSGFFGALLAVSLLGAQAYGVFQPGGALSGTWNSQNVNLAAGTPFIAGTLPDARLSSNVPLKNASNGFTQNQLTTGEWIAGTDNGQFARFYNTEAITAHAHYGFLDDATVNYVPAGTIGHASFNSNTTFSGTTGSDHHHDYQASPHYGNSGTLGRLSSFWSLPDTTAGTVTELSEFKCNNPTGSGTITSLYCFRGSTLSRGANNYGFTVMNRSGVGIDPPTFMLHVKQPSDSSGFSGFGVERFADDSYFGFSFNSAASEWRFVASYNTTGAYQPMTFWTSDAKRLTINIDGSYRFDTTTATTVGAAGGATALPALPLGYIAAFIGGTAVKIPYYNN